MKLTRASRWKSLITCIVLLVHLGPASAAPAEQIAEFVAIAKAQVRTDEAAAALRDGAPDEYFRWGEEGCRWVGTGNADLGQLTENLASFFGDDLSAALVFAAREVICPELRQEAVEGGAP